MRNSWLLTVLWSVIAAIVFTVSATASVAACVLTDEYKQVQIEVGEIVFGEDNAYSKCLNAANASAYWKAMSKCKTRGEGQGVGGGCGHLVGYGLYKESTDISHCDVFKFEPSAELAENLLNELVKARGIDKCR